MSIVTGALHPKPNQRRPPSDPPPNADAGARSRSTATLFADAPDRAGSMLDELWLARARHLARSQRGVGAVVVHDGRHLAETSAGSIARAVRDAASLAGNGARVATLYLAAGASPFDPRALHAELGEEFVRVVVAPES